MGDPSDRQAYIDPVDLGPGPRLRMLWAYGMGDAGTGMAASLIGFYLFIFYTSAVGMAPWMAGLVLMLARLWDAINDPIVGWLSDKTKTPWGPRLPWIVGSAVPLGVAMALMWWVPPGGIWIKFAIWLWWRLPLRGWLQLQFQPTLGFRFRWRRAFLGRRRFICRFPSGFEPIGWSTGRPCPIGAMIPT